MATRVRQAIRLASGDSTDTRKWHKMRMQALMNVRHPFMTLFDELQRYILPRLNRDFMRKTRTPARPMSMDDIIDATATQAHNITQSGMMAGITSPARRWLKTVARKQAAGEDVPHEYVEYLMYLDDTRFRFWDRTDLYALYAGIYAEVLLFGTAAGFGLENPGDPDNPFVWGQLLGGEYVIGENAAGHVDTIYREYAMTVAQVMARFDRERVSERVRQRYRDGAWDEPVALVQGFTPAPWVDVYTAGSEDRWQLLVFEADRVTDDHVEGDSAYLMRTLHSVFPAFCPRWERTGNTPWGMSPGMEALPDVKQLQEMEEKKGVALSLLINPPLQGPPSAEQQRITSLPGDVNFIEGAGQGQGLSPVYQIQPRINEWAEDMDRVRERVRRSFKSDMWLAFIDRAGVQPINESEIYERKEEKLLTLAPLMDRLDRELIRPTVEITDDYLYRTGQLDDPPDGLEEFELEYLNIIAVAQRTQGLTAIADTVSFASTLASKQVEVGQDPTAMDNIDPDHAVRSFAEKRGADVSLLTEPGDMEELRAQRAQMQQQAAALEAEQQAAATAKDTAAAEELASRTQRDQGPLASGGGPGGLPADMGAIPA